MATPALNYPWFELASGDDLEQGDILDDCPVFLPPDELAEEPSFARAGPLGWLAARPVDEDGRRPGSLAHGCETIVLS